MVDENIIGPPSLEIEGASEKQNGDKKSSLTKASVTKSVSDRASTNDSEAASEFDVKQKIKYGKKHQAAYGIFAEYCTYSTIHGLKYLGESKRPFFDRLLWTLVFLFSIFVCFSFTNKVWHKWNSKPVIVSFAETSTPVWQIPFPSITICSETKVKKSIFDFERSFGKSYTNSTLRYVDLMMQLCEQHLINKSNLNFLNKTEKGTDTAKRLLEMAAPFDETFRDCRWRGEQESCETLFTPILTEEGICYTYNSLDTADVYREKTWNHGDMFIKNSGRELDWTIEKGFNLNARSNSTPSRVLAAGPSWGLLFYLQSFKPDYDQLCRGPTHGFKVVLHTPGEMPLVSKHYLRLPFESESIISIKPKIITTSNGLKPYKPLMRQCFFQHERYLGFFKIYTQSNCEFECLTNFTLSKCGCVKFSMPRNKSTPVCTGYHVQCMDDAENEMTLSEFKQGSKISELNYRGESICNCLPSCTSIIYNSEVFTAKFNYKRTLDPFENDENIDWDPGMELARVSIYFKGSQFLAAERSEMYGTTDFIANCGGLLGLFMGVSVLSVIELLYFCTVRLVTNLRMRKKKRSEMKILTTLVPDIVVDEPGGLCDHAI